MNINSQEVFAIGSTGLAVTSGASSHFHWFDYINHNAPGIGVILSFFFGIIGIVFMIKTFHKEKKVDVNEARIEAVEKFINVVKERLNQD